MTETINRETSVAEKCIPPILFRHSLVHILCNVQHCSSGADLGGFVLVRRAARALRLFRPLSLQVRADDGIERYRPPHARAQLVRSGLSSCQNGNNFLIQHAATG